MLDGTVPVIGNTHFRALVTLISCIWVGATNCTAVHWFCVGCGRRCSTTFCGGCFRRCNTTFFNVCEVELVFMKQACHEIFVCVIADAECSSASSASSASCSSAESTAFQPELCLSGSILFFLFCCQLPLWQLRCPPRKCP